MSELGDGLVLKNYGGGLCDILWLVVTILN